jgi:hypothetical protein
VIALPYLARGVNLQTGFMVLRLFDDVAFEVLHFKEVCALAVLLNIANDDTTSEQKRSSLLDVGCTEHGRLVIGGDIFGAEDKKIFRRLASIRFRFGHRQTEYAFGAGQTSRRTRKQLLEGQTLECSWWRRV